LHNIVPPLGGGATGSVSARGAASNAFGEGLLDGLDMGGF
jgi:hypothetical protein